VNVFTPSAEEKAGHSRVVGPRLLSFLTRMVSLATAHRRERRLRLCEMLSLGEKRFVAVVEYGTERFLLAGTPQNIALLKRLKMNVDEATTDARSPEPNRE
jgi:flagellar biogenesis protein FliO